jgi:integrase
VKKERFLTHAELARLGDALRATESDSVNPAALTAIRLLVLTGCRRGEVVGLRWEWVDFQRRILNLPHSKTGAKSVPLGAAALELLKEMKPKVAGWVFPAARGDGPIVGLHKVWQTVRTNASLPGVRIHDLRHSFASIAVAAGDSLYLVGKVLGHRQAKTTELYAHLANDPLLDVADRTSKRIADAIAARQQEDNETVVALAQVVR